MSDISLFRGKSDPDSVAARRIWARKSNLAYKEEDTRTYLPIPQCLAEALLLKDELLCRIAGLDAKIEELRDMQ